MEIYLLKSIGCLTILFIFYKAVLERESFHNFKRFYLLGSVIAALLIPLITFTQYVEVTEPAVSFLTSEGSFEIVEQRQPNVPIGPIVIWAIYGAGLLFFGSKFFRNLFRLGAKIKKNPTIKNKNLFHVLLQTPTVPHTFLQYIFLNKTKFEKNEIPSEVLLHEEAHALQKHSIDVLFIEFLQVLFWFNPLFYFIKHSIKLNHEFLADQAVLNNGIDTSHYQNILLAFSSSAATPTLANSINYSFIKKRFTVMKTKTSRRNTWLKSLLFLPLLAILTYSFSTTETITTIASDSNGLAENSLIENNNTFTTNPEAHLTARSITIEILDSNAMMVDGINIRKEELYNTLTSLHTDITKEQRDRIINIHVSSKGKISYDDLVYIQKVGSDYGYHRIVTPKEEIIRSKGNTPMAPESTKATPKQIAKYNRMATFWNQRFEETNKRVMPLDQLRELESIYRIMNSQQKATAAPFPHCDLEQTSASRDEMREYNTLAKKYNDAEGENLFIRKKDVERLKYIYEKMSSKQRADAEPFPNFPPPPPPPPGPDAPEPPKVFKDRKNNTWTSDSEGEIPPPPPPPNPVDHVIKMAKKGADFYLNGKKVSSDAAIDAIKKNSDLNIQIQENNGKDVVKITKAPIQLGKDKQSAADFQKGTKDAVAHLKKLANEGAHFVLFDGGPHFPDGEKITAKKALEIVEKVNGLTIDVKDEGYIYKIVEIRMKGC